MFKVEMHTHVNPGSCDSTVSSEDLMVELRKKDYDGVVITNHYSLCCVKKVADSSCDRLKEIHLGSIRACKEVGDKYGIKVYAGVEYTISRNLHFSIIGVTEDMLKLLPEPEKDFNELFSWAKAHDVFLINNHPCREDYECVVSEGIGYEVVNTKKPQFIELAATECLKLTKHLSPVYICGGDIHMVSHIGKCGLEFEHEPVDERELMRMIVSKQFNMMAPVNINTLVGV